MPFPTFRPDDLFSEWSDCTLEICCGCGQASHAPVKLLGGELGDLTFKAYLSRLVCKQCKARPGPVYLCTGHDRRMYGGGPPDWALEVVADPK